MMTGSRQHTSWFSDGGSSVAKPPPELRWRTSDRPMEGAVQACLAAKAEAIRDGLDGLIGGGKCLADLPKLDAAQPVARSQSGTGLHVASEASR